MALYEYVCSTCHKEFELMRPMSEADQSAACPACNSEAQRIISSLGLRKRDSLQVPRIPPRSRSATRTPTGKAKTAKTAKKRIGLRATSQIERRTGYRGGPSEERFREEMDLWRSTNSTTAPATAVLEEGVAVDSEVDSRQAAAPVEMSWLAEYQPGGGNLWFIQDWGIASILGYLRNREETEPTEGRLYPMETMGADLAEVDEYHHRVLDQQTVASIQLEVAARPAEAADSQLPASEEQSVTSVRPWTEETAMEPAEFSKDASHQTDVNGVEGRLDEATSDLVQDIEPHNQPAEEEAAHAARRSSLRGEMLDTDFPDEVVKAAWRRQGGRCAGCGRWLIWPFRGRDSGTGAWEPHRRISEEQGGRNTLANCLIFCSGVADCHFNRGHGGIGWSHYAPLNDSELVFLFDVSTVGADYTAPTRHKRSLLRTVLGIPQSEGSKKLPVAD